MSHHFNPYRRHSHYRTNMPDNHATDQERQMHQEEPAIEPENAPDALMPEENPAEESSAEANASETETPLAHSDELEEMKKQLQDDRIRMAAEMDNFKKRLNREHQEQMRFAAEKVLGDLLPALDNLDLAIQYGSDHEACATMMQGIEMTRKLLLDAVAKNGLITIGEQGEEFNPAFHEAIGMEANPEMEKGAITRVMQRGYKLNDRVLRPAKVMVNN